MCGFDYQNFLSFHLKTLLIFEYNNNDKNDGFMQHEDEKSSIRGHQCFCIFQYTKVYNKLLLLINYDKLIDENFLFFKGLHQPTNNT